MFAIGDHIVHPMYGAGVITEIVEKDFLGELRKYYSVSLPHSRMETSVPVDSCDKIGIRPIISLEDIPSIIEVLGQEPEKLNLNWNKRYRENTERMQSGNVLEVAAVVRNLTVMDRVKPLSTGEKKLLSTAKQILESEIACAQNKALEEIDKIIEESIK